MKLKNIFLSSTSACFEIESSSPYYSEKKYDVYLNGERVITDEERNVFSLFSLAPDTEYTLSVGDCRLSFRTMKESCALNIKDFGAVGDGATDDSEAIRAAISACKIGGRVYVPKGVYLTEPIRLKSDMTLELGRGAVLLGFVDPKRFEVLPAYKEIDGEERIFSAFEGEAVSCYSSFISAYFEKNINVVGEGVIDANANNSVWWTREYVKESMIKRPRLVFLNGCENVNFHGILGKNSPAWNFHPFFSKRVGYYDVRVEAHKDSPNTDGINPECCSGVEIIGARISVGDDCVAIKSGKIGIGMKYKTPTEKITIRNCLMEFGHGGVVLGSEISGGIRELSVTGCIFSGTERGLRIKTRRGRGKYCVVDGIEFENILMERVGVPFVVNMHYNCDVDGNSDYVQSRTPLPIDDRTPTVGRLKFKNIKASGTQAAAAYFEGLCEMPISEVTLEDVSIKFDENAKEGEIDGFLPKTFMKRAGLIFKNVKRVNLNGVLMEDQLGERIVTENVEMLEEK